ALTAMVDDERGAWLLADHLEGEVELALAQTSSEGVRELVVDRTFVDEDGTRWIVDYKTGGHEGGDLTTFLDTEQERYSAQLENYAKVMREMDDRPIRLGLYFPLIRAWRDWLPADR
ncbi:MAG: PD-(D/E)XK nuclease family protein, partial [Gammaproteobacteria bacterium]